MTWLAVSAQLVVADEIKLAEVADLKSSLHLQLKTDIQIKGMMLDDKTKLIFKDDTIMTAPSIVIRSGEKGSVEIIKEYETGDVDDRPFEGLKITLWPRFDFITGKVINSGKIIISQATRIGSGKIENSIETISHDFESWSKHWNAIGDQSLSLKINDTNTIKIYIKWSAISPSGNTLNIKQGEQDTAEQSATAE